MSFLTTKALPRRTVLRGMGASIALPFLDSMVPAYAASAAATAPKRRRPRGSPASAIAL
jgi:hypothetical protein